MKVRKIKSKMSYSIFKTDCTHRIKWSKLTRIIKGILNYTVCWSVVCYLSRNMSFSGYIIYSSCHLESNMSWFLVVRSQDSTLTTVLLYTEQHCCTVTVMYWELNLGLLSWDVRWKTSRLEILRRVNRRALDKTGISHSLAEISHNLTLVF